MFPWTYGKTRGGSHCLCSGPTTCTQVCQLRCVTSNLTKWCAGGWRRTGNIWPAMRFPTIPLRKFGSFMGHLGPESQTWSVHVVFFVIVLVPLKKGRKKLPKVTPQKYLKYPKSQLTPIFQTFSNWLYDHIAKVEIPKWAPRGCMWPFGHSIWSCQFSYMII